LVNGDQNHERRDLNIKMSVQVSAYNEMTIDFQTLED